VKLLASLLENKLNGVKYVMILHDIFYWDFINNKIELVYVLKKIKYNTNKYNQ